MILDEPSFLLLQIGMQLMHMILKKKMEELYFQKESNQKRNVLNGICPENDERPVYPLVHE